MHRLIIFDDGLAHLGPMTDLRAAFEVRSGMLTTAARICAAYPKSLCGYWVPEHIAPVVAERANAPVNTLPHEEVLLCVSGRWGIPDPDLAPAIGHALVEEKTGHVVSALLRRADAEYFLTTGQLHERVKTHPLPKRVLYRYPWDVIGLGREAIRHDILSNRMDDAKVLDNSVAIVGDEPVEVHATATIWPNVVFDATDGPIQVHDHAVIRPNTTICGPASIGAHCVITDRSLIKSGTAMGPWCKIGGEVGGTIIQGYSNKSHDGHLGDSWLGKWVNLGAGTTNSNLLNTYGEVVVRLDPDGPRHRSGLQFLGSIIGDHVKTAINTRLMTGTVLGSGSMVASTAAPPTSVGRFAWLTDAGERSYRLDKFVDVMKTIMRRRDVDPGPAYLEAVAELHRLHVQEGVAV